MAIQKIELGTEPHGVGGDSYRTANEKINSNFEEIVKDIKGVSDDNLETLDKLSEEVLRAKSAESDLQSSIDAEAVRAKAAESDLNSDIIKEVSDRESEVTRLDEADTILQAQINSVGGGKLAYKTYAEMVEDKSNIAANSSIDIIADTDDKNGTYLYDGTNFVKSQYDIEKIIRAKVQNTFGTYAQMVASNLSDGAYALVADDVDTNNNGIYIKQGDSWVKSKFDLASKNYVDKGLDFVSKNSDGTYPFMWSDVNGSIALALDSSGMLHTTSLSIKDFTIEQEQSGSFADYYVIKINDKNNNTAFAITKDGSIEVSKLIAKSIETDSLTNTDVVDVNQSEKIVSAEINGINSYGQSLAVGQTAYPVISTTQPYNNITFNFGVRSLGKQDSEYTGFMPLIESQASSLGETPVSGTANTVTRLMLDDNNLTSPDDLGYRILGSSAGKAGTPLSGLVKGSTPFAYLIKDIVNGNRLAKQIGEIYKYQATTWMQGEADYSASSSKEYYKSTLGYLVEDIATEAKNATGQAHNPVFISYQCGGHLRYAKSQNTPSAFNAQIAQAQLELSLERGDFLLACPMYQLDYSGTVDQVHITAADSVMVGSYFGIAYKKSVIDGEKFKPLMPIAIESTEKSIYIKLNVPQKPLTIDTTWVLENENYGFRVFNGATKLNIEEVRLIYGDTIKITTNETLAGNFKVDYALFSNDSTGETGRKVGARGNIRDSQGDLMQDTNGRNLHNWLIMFSYTKGESKWL